VCMRERYSVSVCVCLYVCVSLTTARVVCTWCRSFVCERESQKESVCVYVCVCVHVCVCPSRLYDMRGTSLL